MRTNQLPRTVRFCPHVSSISRFGLIDNTWKKKQPNLKLARKGLDFQIFILSNFVAHFHHDIYLREGFKYSKWKFKMFFSMKGGSRVPHTYSEK